MGPEREEVHVLARIAGFSRLGDQALGLSEIHAHRLSLEISSCNEYPHVKPSTVCTCLYAWGTPLMHDIHRGRGGTPLMYDIHRVWKEGRMYENIL